MIGGSVPDPDRFRSSVTFKMIELNLFKILLVVS